MEYLVLDTNILLLDANNLLTLGSPNTTIVLPETVIDELDSKKSVQGELGYQARQFGRLLTSATNTGCTRRSNVIVTTLDLDGNTIEISSLNQYPNYEGVEPNILNDRKIIEIALHYNSDCGNTTFMSNDVMCRIRATSLGLESKDLKLVDDTDPDFIKDLIVSSEQFGTLHNSNIFTINPDHKPENYNYRFTCATTNQMKVATIKSNNLIDLIGKATESALRAQDVNPSNLDQLLLSAAIQDPSVDLVIAEAPAGTGKTITAISNAMKLVKQNNSYESITYIRASIDDVEDIEKVGFLPGTATEKNSVYLHPLFDTLDFIVRNRHKKSKLKGQEFEEFVLEKIAELEEKYNIRAMTGLGMRGRTFNNTIAIIDEVQGQSKASLQKILTRFGKNCKVIVAGSNRQIDNPYVTKYNNGLSVLLSESTKQQDIIRMHVVPLSKIVRSPMAEWSERAFSKDIT